MLREEMKNLTVNIIGMMSLLITTMYIYEKTNQPLIILIGSLILVLAILGSTMG